MPPRDLCAPTPPPQSSCQTAQPLRVPSAQEWPALPMVAERTALPVAEHSQGGQHRLTQPHGDCGARAGSPRIRRETTLQRARSSATVAHAQRAAQEGPAQGGTGPDQWHSPCAPHERAPHTPPTLTTSRLPVGPAPGWTPASGQLSGLPRSPRSPSANTQGHSPASSAVRAQGRLCSQHVASPCTTSSAGQGPNCTGGGGGGHGVSHL